MKGFFTIFANSAAELKNIRCITVTGILIAVFIVLDLLSIPIGGFIKININFIALAAVGMLYGPVPAVLAGVAGDLIGCLIAGNAPLPLLTVTAALSGLIYGVCLYGRSGTRLVIFSITARVFDSLIVSLGLNTAILMQAGFMSKTAEQFYLRYGLTATQLIVFIPLIIAAMPTVRGIYERVVKQSTGHKKINGSEI